MSFSKYPLKNLEYLVIASGSLVTVATLIWLLIYSRYGIDLTDESHYLIWIANPDFYPVSVTQFGFIYHPLHWLVQGDITRLRQANILIIFSLAWALCVVFFRATAPSWRNRTMLALAGIAASSALVYFCPYGWIVTPSYNSLVFQGLIIVSIGFLLAEKHLLTISIVGWMLIGVGGWLVFMAKPSSAAALVVLISVCLPLAGKFNFRLFALSVLTAIIFLIISAWLIDGSMLGFIQRLKDGLEAVRLLDAGQLNLFRIDKISIGNKERVFFVSFSAITLFVLYLAFSERKVTRILGFIITLLLAIFSLALITGYVTWQITTTRETHTALLILVVPLSIAVFGLLSPAVKMSKVHWVIAVYFAILPFVAAFGTNNNNWVQGSFYSLFWLLTGLTILMPVITNADSWQVLLPAVVSGQLLSVFLLQAAMVWPYRQPQSIYQYDDVVTVGAYDSKLLLPNDLADYFRNVQTMAQQAGFQAGTPMIDMTGEGPGTLYALQAKAIGYPWLIGGYAGSNNMVEFALSQVPCADIAAAWLLIDSDNLLKLSPTLLNHIGLDFEQDFEMAKELAISPTTVARHGIPSKRLQIWKPKLSTQNRSSVCEQKRNLT